MTTPDDRLRKGDKVVLATHMRGLRPGARGLVIRVGGFFAFRYTVLFDGQAEAFENLKERDIAKWDGD